MHTHLGLDLERPLEAGLVDFGFEEPGLHQLLGLQVHAVDASALEAGDSGFDCNGEGAEVAWLEHLEVTLLTAWWED